MGGWAGSNTAPLLGKSWTADMPVFGSDSGASCLTPNDLKIAQRTPAEGALYETVCTHTPKIAGKISK